MTLIRRPQIRLHPLAIPGRRCPGAAVDDEGLAFGVLQDHPLLGALFHHQQRRIGVLREVIQIDLARRQQAMDQAEDHQPVRARRDADPVIGHGIVAGADRVDPDHPRAARLQAPQTDLDRIAVVILGHAEEDEQLGTLPVRLPEFPERPADGVDAPRRHVDRAEPAMRGIVRRAERLRPPAGERLRLIAPGEKRQLLRRRLAQRPQPRHRQRQRLVPGNLLKRPRPPRPHPPERRPEPARRRHLHDPACALAAQHPLVDRMIPVALDVTHLPRLQMHIDPAPARAHVTRRPTDHVRGGGIEGQIMCHSGLLSQALRPSCNNRFFWASRNQRALSERPERCRQTAR